MCFICFHHLAAPPHAELTLPLLAHDRTLLETNSFASEELRMEVCHGDRLLCRCRARMLPVLALCLRSICTANQDDIMLLWWHDLLQVCEESLLAE